MPNNSDASLKATTARATPLQWLNAPAMVAVVASLAVVLASVVVAAQCVRGDVRLFIVTCVHVVCAWG